MISGEEDVFKTVVVDSKVPNRRNGGAEDQPRLSEEALPIFSFEDEARMFLELGASGCWRVRETTAGEITSVLFGLCAGVDRVVLDPLPGLDAEALMDLASMGRETFMESYLKNKESSPLAAGLGRQRRQAALIARRATLQRR